MRVDKFLKVSRLLKRRSIACDACNEGLVEVNDKVAKAGLRLKIGDILKITLGSSIVAVKVLDLNEKVSKANSVSLYEVINENQ